MEQKIRKPLAGVSETRLAQEPCLDWCCDNKFVYMAGSSQPIPTSPFSSSIEGKLASSTSCTRSCGRGLLKVRFTVDTVLRVKAVYPSSTASSPSLNFVLRL